MSAEEVIGILMSLTAISSYLNYRYIKIPKSIGLTLITLSLSFLTLSLSFIIGLISSKLGWDPKDFAIHLLDGISFTDTFLHGMLGYLLFAASLHVNTRELSKHKTIIGLLATVSVLLSTIIVGFGTYALTQLLNIDIPLAYCLVFGALISPTDPIAVLGILKTANAPKGLEMKIAGEALFNDGMGIVLFAMLLEVATGDGTACTWQGSVVHLVQAFLTQGLGGIVLGLVMGWLAARLLRTIDNHEVAILLTLGVVAGGHAFAHSVAQVSGPVCMAVAGLSVGALLQDGSMSRDSLRRLASFWEVLDAILNALLFVTIGLEFVILSFTSEIILASVGVIIITVAARWISVMIPVGSLSMFRKFSSEVVLLMTWGGLRGGISIALALSIPNGIIRDFIVSITSIVVLFSIMVQGLTLGSLVRRFFGFTANHEKLPVNIVPATMADKTV